MKFLKNSVSNSQHVSNLACFDRGLGKKPPAVWDPPNQLCHVFQNREGPRRCLLYSNPPIILWTMMHAPLSTFCTVSALSSRRSPRTQRETPRPARNSAAVSDEFVRRSLDTVFRCRSAFLDVKSTSSADVRFESSIRR